MRNIIQNLKQFEDKHFKNILIYNCEDIERNDILEIANFTENLYVLCYSNFLISSLSIKLRFYKNIRISSINCIPQIPYDVIISHNVHDIFDFLINNPEIKYFMYLKNNELNIPGYERIGNNIYYRDPGKILVDINESFNKFNETKNRIDNSLLPDNIIKQNNNVKKTNYFEINVKNVVPVEVKYDKQCKRKIIDGIIGIKYIINNENDVKIYNEMIEKIFEKYEYIKTYIIFNGKNTFKYLSDIKNCNSYFKFEEKQSDEILKNMLDNFCNHEYSFDLINDEIDNEWKFLK